MPSTAHPTLTWKDVWVQFEIIWKDSAMLRAFGPDKQVQLLGLTAQMLFLDRQDNETIRQALIHINNGGFLDMGG